MTQSFTAGSTRNHHSHEKHVATERAESAEGSVSGGTERGSPETEVDDDALAVIKVEEEHMSENKHDVARLTVIGPSFKFVGLTVAKPRFRSSADSDAIPSVLLRSLSASLTPDTFIELLENHLYPVLDSLPISQRCTVADALTAAQGDRDRRVRQKIRKIDFETHKKSLDGGLKALWNHVRRNWHDEYEKQWEMTNELAGEILSWLPDLWRTAVEDGIELPLIRRCLVLCSEVVHRMDDCNSRAEFLAGDFMLTIKNSKGTKIYEENHAYMDRPLDWMWREILIAAMTRGGPGDKMLIRQGEEEETSEGYPFDDDHWTQAMKDAASHLTQARIASLQEAPSAPLYDSLIQRNPDLKLALLQATRVHIFTAGHQRPTTLYRDAVVIFQKSSQTADLVRLLDALPQFSPDPTVLEARLEIVKYLSMQPLKEHRDKALGVIESELRHSKESVVDQLNPLRSQKSAFSDFDSPLLYSYYLNLRTCTCTGQFFLDLATRVSLSVLSSFDPQELLNSCDKTLVLKHSLSSQHSPDFTMHAVTCGNGLTRQRDRYLDKFIKCACRRDDGNEFNDFEDDRMMGWDENDSDHAEEKEARQPLEHSIRDWVLVLQSFPDKVAAARVWNRVKESGSDYMVFAVDGVADDLADALADRCDWGYHHSSDKQHIADCLPITLLYDLALIYLLDLRVDRTWPNTEVGSKKKRGYKSMEETREPIGSREIAGGDLEEARALRDVDKKETVTAIAKEELDDCDGD
ncbi:hypothetical protein EW146_g5823 [Bondarzewia mesenterica]|uniref:Uncharacterized protein n=1 Tax=Bondarzewia mesenterica TaxID=1095465 RepID=A0A4S4LQD3_9AGAM|nr:hypothetical protein EW146_g5823 [Bondarzewia mesenterica]